MPDPAPAPEPELEPGPVASANTVTVQVKASDQTLEAVDLEEEEVELDHNLEEVELDHNVWSKSHVIVEMRKDIEENTPCQCDKGCSRSNH